MIPKLIDRVSNLVIIEDEIIIITMISRYFQVWNKINESHKFLSQNFESFLACLLLLDQCKNIFTDF